MKKDLIYNLLKEIFELTDGPWSDPVISENLYFRMKAALEMAECNHETAIMIHKGYVCSDCGELIK